MYYPVKLFTLFFLTVFLLYGCNKKQSESVEVGLLIHALDHERWENDRDFFITKVQELGGTVKVQIADNDANKQMALNNMSSDS